MFHLIRITRVVVVFLLITCAPTLAQNLKSPDEHLRRGKEHLAAEKYDKAIKEFKEATRLKPEWAEAYYQLGLAHWGEAQRSGKFQKAVEAFEEAIRLKPDLAEAHYQLAEIKIALNESVSAVDFLKEALRLKPDFAEAHHSLGSAYLYQGRDREAIGPLEEAVRLKPKLAIAQQLLGLAYLINEQREKAWAQHKVLQSLDLKMADLLAGKIQAPERFTLVRASGPPINSPKLDYSSRITWLGKVLLELMIDEEGKVTSAQALNGPPDIRKISENTALKARYAPTRVSGKPVRARALLYITFERR